MPRRDRRLVAVALVLLMAPIVAAADATYTVKPGPFKIEVLLTGVFETQQMKEVVRAPKAWGQMRVLWAAEPGAVVKKGDPLVKLEPKDLDKKIRDIEAGEALAALALKQAREELRLLEVTTPEQRAWARRAERIAVEGFEYYLETDVTAQKGHFALGPEWGEIRWLRATAEFDRLKRIYGADNVIESTEALVIKKQKHGVERTKVDLERREFVLAWDENVKLPRQIKQKRKAVRDAETALDRGETMLEITLRRKRLQVAKLEYDRAKARKELEKLKADRAAMTIRAPAGGVVYYGRRVNGKWTDADKMADKLKPGGQLAANEVFMTVVRPAALSVRVAAAEKDLHNLREGMTAQVIPTGYPKHKFGGKVESVRIAPGGPAPYTASISLTGKPGPVRPGMTCKLRMLVYENKQAITVPGKAVFGQRDRGRRVVYLQGKESRPLKRRVRVGRQRGDKVEIIEGLSDGDVILLEKPGT